MDLSRIFASVSIKKLVQVDLPDGSHQHEINGVSSLRDFFGVDQKTETSVQWSYFYDDGEIVSSTSKITFYDARANHPSRSEWRLYYTDDLLELAHPGDFLVLVKRPGYEDLRGLILEQDSTWVEAFARLSGVSMSAVEQDLIVLSRDQLRRIDLGFIEKRILEELGFEEPISDFPTSDIDLIFDNFGDIASLPPTRQFSAFARSIIDVDIARPDEALMSWIERETQLFNAAQFHFIQAKITAGFTDVDDFLRYSSSIMNTRKSRMGLVVENHLEAIFEANNVRYSRNGVTEPNCKPDFVFPGIRQYHDLAFRQDNLRMLAVKSTLKERWREVLAEAARISRKHLFTLDLAISREQFADIYSRQLTLVFPEPIRSRYFEAYPNLNLGQFINEVKTNQVD